MRTPTTSVLNGLTAVVFRLGVVVVAAFAAGCNGGQAVLTQQVTAERLVNTLHVEFSKANEAANRAVLADTDEASSDAARDANTSMAAAADSLSRLQPLLASLGYTAEGQTAEQFAKRLAELQELDAQILPLAAENTNLKAQRLSFGEAQAAVDTAVKVLRAADGQPGSEETDVVVERIIGSLREIQVLEARHIAEGDDAAMTRMEAQMHEAEGVALRGLARLRQIGTTRGGGGRTQSAHPQLQQADEAIERFLAVNQQIVDLSRRNTNVRSLALTLGRRRVVAAACEDLLRTLQTAIAGHEFKATR